MFLLLPLHKVTNGRLPAIRKLTGSMKKYILVTLLMFVGVSFAMAQSQAEITFDKLIHDFGQFPSNSPVQKATFNFTNTGTAPLVINQATASCGCTVAEYTKQPVMPGEKGKVSVTYNGTGKFPGYFKKSISVRTNAKQDVVRLYIKGEMTESGTDKK